MLALLLACGLILSSGDRVDPDLWGHVKYGEDVLTSGHLPRTATHTFTAPSQPWINHENLSEILFALLARDGGARDLLLLKALLGLVLVWLVLNAGLRKGASLLTCSIIGMLVAYNLAPGWTVRPQLFTYVFFGLLLALLDLAFEEQAGVAFPRRRRAALCAIPLLFAIWANTHGGFVAGLVVLAVFLACRALVSLGTTRAVSESAVCFLVLIGSALATLLNPYGTDLITWLVWDLAPPRPEITEWGPLVLSDLRFVPFIILLGVTAFAWLRSERPRALSETVLLGAATWQSIAHVRHVPLLALMVGFWLPPHLESAFRRRRRETVEAARGRTRWGTFELAVWLMVLALGAGLAARTRALYVNKAEYPVEAFAYMAENGINGRLVAHFDWSQYAIAAFAPRTTVAFDGRFRTSYPQEIADMHFDFILGDAAGRRWRSPNSPPIDGTRVLDFGTPDLVLLSRNYPNAVAVMRERQDWTLLYQDALAQLWGRRSRYDRQDSADFLPSRFRSVTEQPQSGFVPWPALPLVKDHPPVE